MIKEKFGRELANIGIKPFFNIFVKKFLGNPKAYYRNDIDSRLNYLRLALYFRDYEFRREIFLEIPKIYHLTTLKGRIISSIDLEIVLGVEGEEWRKNKDVFYLLNTDRPGVLTNLRNSYTEDCWKRVSFTIDEKKFTSISPIRLLRMYKENVL